MSDNEAGSKKRQGERNPGASLQQKLRNYAKATHDDVSLVLVRYLNKRFLYRLSVSPYRDRFILRGATLFTVWDAELHRATRDIDLLATGDSSPKAIPTGKLLFPIFASFAEFERDHIIENTRVGLQAARGRKGGRRTVMDAKKIAQARALAADPNRPVKEICETLEIFRNTFYRHIPEKNRPAPQPES